MTFPIQYEDETWTTTDKPEKVLKMVEEAIALLHKEKNCQHIRNDLDKVREGLKYEIEKRKFWKFENSLPYYGG